MMSFQDTPNLIRWRLHLSSSPEAVFEMLATSKGRAKFWAESAQAHNGVIDFKFPNGLRWEGKILETAPPNRFCVQYFGGTTVTFSLTPDGRGGCELVLTDEGVATPDRTEVIAGWVSVLFALKAAVDYGIDLRNHDPTRTWDQGYAEN